MTTAVIVLSVALLVSGVIIYRLQSQLQNLSQNNKANDALNDLNEKITAQEVHLGQLLSGVEKNAESLKAQLKQITSVQTLQNSKPTEEGLDQIVKERTQKLQQKRLEIAEYAFINSSKMRAPMATILGLISVLELGETENGQSIEEMVAYLKYSVERLDKMLNDMNETLGKEFYEQNPVQDKEIVLN